MRLNYTDLAPESTDALWALSKSIAKSSLDPQLRELVAVLVSIRNGCAHCISIHWHKALQAGVSEESLRLVTAYRETKRFSAAERAAFEIADRMTTNLAAGVPDEMVHALVKELGDEGTAMHLLYHVILMNAWNRLSIAIGLQPPTD